MLEDKLRELLGHMCGGDGQPPLPSTLRIAEAAKGKWIAVGRFLLPRSELKTPEEYAPRFDELMASSYDWLNLSYYGILEGYGLVMVEYPRQASVPMDTDERTRTAVSYCGPMKCVADAGWDAGRVVVLV